MAIITRSLRRKIEPCILALQRRWFTLRTHVDPITMEKIGLRAFLHVGEDGAEMYFDAKALASFILSSGDYRNPLTRKTFNAAEIMRLARRSGMHDIVNVDAAKERRELEMQRNSLREFFLGDLQADFESIFESQRSTGPASATISLMIRSMVTTSLPSIVLNCVRVYRTDRDFVEEYFAAMFRILGDMRMSARADMDANRMTMIMIYEQCCCDLKARCMDGSLSNSSSVQVSVGGLRISVNVNSI